MTTTNKPSNCERLEHPTRAGRASAARIPPRRSYAARSIQLHHSLAQMGATRLCTCYRTSHSCGARRDDGNQAVESVTPPA